ncbi:hypothetical protein J2W32_004482 [Variovorax boronicumulans]|uniref:Uncharacterized protein n=1 Tax=Variovorax boronicumulans TaxID=436515 RepID=A0AAW8D570_9BURK|nr:hypothetical protein [Variovorax boronicumulans]MDP9895384.1 hypothetical protein [Variovorax boronicumulans]MDQ0055424.1 hypothetical protein [Variovorax boronicumulans]
MSNSLHRSGYSYSVPAVPYVPYRPAYTYVEPIFGYTRPNGWSMDIGSAVATPPSSGGSGIRLPDGTWLPNGFNVVAKGVSSPNTPKAGVTTGGTQPTYGIIGFEVVSVPEQPEQPGTPGARISVPPPGWNAFARSIRGIRGGEATFTVPVGVSGVVVGLAEYASPEAGYGHIRHGLRFGGDRVSNARTGVEYGGFDASDSFRISFDGVDVRFTQNGGLLDTEASTYRPEPLYLSAALYDTGDMLDNPVLTGIGVGNSSATLPLLQSFAFEDDYAEALTTLPAMTTAAGTGNFGHAVLPALAGLAGSVDVYGAAITTLPALTVVSYGGMAPGVGANAADISLPVLMGAAVGLTGETGDVETSLPELQGLIAETNYGETKTVLPMMTVFAFTEGNDEAYALETMATSATLAGDMALLAVVLENIGLGTTAVPTALLDAVIQELLSAAPSVATEQLLEVIARTFIEAGSSGLLEGATGRTDLDTWVWHADAGGSTMYRGYPFNSFAVIDGKHYGASADGLFLLEGDDDAGVPIHASIDLGQLDFGTAELKTVAECYLGMSAKGNLFLKVIAEGREFIYKTRSFSEQMQQQRITPGKGLKTNYVTAQFFNEDGADFEIDSVRFVVADLSRRIN